MEIDVTQKHYMIVDVSNLLHRTFYVHTQEEFSLITAMAYKSTFMTLNKYYKDFKPNRIVLAFDDHNNWRKKYTASGECVTKRQYKGNRRQNLTPKQHEQYVLFLHFIDDFEELLKKHTSIVCIKGKELEADDVIAGFTEAFAEEHKVTILSQDKDFYQLLRNPNVQVCDPATKKITTREDIDVEYLLFEKFFRGDGTDNVQNAYPGVSTKRIQKAFTDKFELANMLQHTWKDPKDLTTYRVKDLFEENKLLMDLSKQPDHIRDRIFEAIEEAFMNQSKYSHFDFLRFLGKYDLKEVSKNVENLIPLLSH